MRTHPAHAEAPPEPGRPSWARSRPRHPSISPGIRYCLVVFVGVRIGLLVLGFVSAGLLPDASRIPGAHDLGIPGPVGVPGWPAFGFTPGWHNLFTVWERFDALWFLRIASSGYRVGDGSAAFFPLYPLAIRVVSWTIGGHPLAAGLIVSNASFLGALILLFHLVSFERTDAVARKTVLYASLFPTSLFFLAPYSESLFLLLTVWAFWAARRDRWAAAALAAALAALTRNVGIILAPALAVEAVHQWREDERSLLPRLAAASAGAIGLGLYLLYWGVRTGAWLAPVTQQANWQRVGVLPWTTLVEGTRFAFQYPGQFPGAYWLLDWLIVVPVLVAGVWAIARLRPAYGLYTGVSLLIPLAFVFRDRPFMSLPRFALVLFPVFWAMAEATERRRIPHTAIVAVGAAGLALLTVLFVNWYYIF